MRKKWSDLKRLIGQNELRDDVFLSMITCDGRIMSANARMLRTFHLENPKKVPVNFLDLLHPFHLSDFKTAIHQSTPEKAPALELYLKNGYYHPMKWHINFLEEDADQTKRFLCVGHPILDEERVEKFNQLGEQHYQLIVEGLSAGVLFQDKQGEIIAANQKAAEIMNVTLERLYQLTDIETLWNTSWEIQSEEEKPVPFDQTPFMKASRTGETQTDVLGIRLRNGEQRWLRYISQPLFEETTGSVYAVVSNIEDITTERLLSRQLKEKEALFNIFMGHTPNLAWVVDEEARLVFASESFYHHFHLDRAKAINSNVKDLMPFVTSTRFYREHMRVLATGQPVKLVDKLDLADGTNFVFHINVFPIDGVTSKRLLGGYAVNLTDKFAAEKQLKEANDRLLMLTRATSDAIWEWDMQTGKIFRNDALMDMIGYQPEAPKGLSWWFRRMHPEDRNRVSDKVKDITEKGLQSWEDEYRFKCADGHYKTMHDRGYVVYENGLPVKMIGSLQDISGVRELEEKLMQEKLARQQEISETVIRVQENERTRIGHELHDNVNQILSTSKLFVDMLKPTNETERQMKQKGVDYIMLAIEEIRKLSKELVVPHLSLGGLIESINAVINDIEISTGIRIKFTHDQENELLSPGKKVTLFRILQEQLKNIIKHSQATHVDIFLQCKDQEAQLIIKDNGIGFDSGKTHRGIGLSNIYERTRFYQGTVAIQTQPGNGCEMIVTIPGFN